MQNSLRVTSLVLALLIAGQTILMAGQPPRAGWTKIGIQSLFKQPNASEAASIKAVLPSDTIVDYDDMTVAYVQKSAIEQIRSLAARLHLRVVGRDADDVLQTGGTTLDTRNGLGNIPKRGLPSAHYNDQEVGLYIVQFIAPQKPEWLDALRRLGAFAVRPLVVNGYLIGATPAVASSIAGAGSVQWVEPLHPFLKASCELTPQTVVAEFADIPGAAEARDRVRGLLIPGTDATDNYVHDGIYAVGSLQAEDVKAALSEPTLIGIHPLSTPGSSDERVALSMTPEGSLGTLPATRQTSYTTWLRSRCPACTSLAANNFKIAVADSGFYEGRADLVPPGYEGRVEYAHDHYQGAGTCNTLFVYCNNGLPCDAYYHGTFVASVAGGDGEAASGTTDLGGYYMATGVAPSAGLVITRMTNSWGNPVLNSYSSPFT